MSSSVKARYLWTKLKDIIDNNSYMQVSLRLALRRTGENTEFCYGRLDLEDRASSESSSYDFGNLLLIQRIFKPSDLEGIIVQLTAGTLSFDSHPIKIHDGERTLMDYDFVPSGSSWNLVEVDRPTTVFIVRSSDSRQIPNETVRSQGDLPYYPSTFDAMAAFMNFTHNPYSPGFVITVPETRAWIKELSISGRQLTLSIDGSDSNNSDLVCKFYHSKGGLRETSNAIPLKQAQATYEMTFESDTIDAALVSKGSGRILDKKTVRGLFPSQRGRKMPMVLCHLML
ncbi:MAG TPA: hypothetical protein VJZ68_06695 [Nitrososphaera sp.]|nr:hypothetical protein [Nitrososphaera sp.]